MKREAAARPKDERPDPTCTCIATSDSYESSAGQAGGTVLAYVAVICTPSGTERRRVYLTLSSAERALLRADARGVPARLVLAELRAVGNPCDGGSAL